MHTYSNSVAIMAQSGFVEFPRDVGELFVDLEWSLIMEIVEIFKWDGQRSCMFTCDTARFTRPQSDPYSRNLFIYLF